MCDGSKSMCNVQLTGTYVSIDSYISSSTVNPEEKGKTHSTPHPNINVEVNFDLWKWRQHWNGERGQRLSFFHGGEGLRLYTIVDKGCAFLTSLPSYVKASVCCNLLALSQWSLHLLPHVGMWGRNVETMGTIFQKSGNYCNLHGNRGIVERK